MENNVFSNTSEENKSTLSQGSTQNVEIPDTVNTVSFDNSNLDLNDWISLKDYANQIGVSYEAVRQQVNKKNDLLGYHIRNIGKTRFIDSEAIAILSKKKSSSKTKNINANKSEDSILDSLQVKDSAPVSKTIQKNTVDTSIMSRPDNSSYTTLGASLHSSSSLETEIYDDINFAINDVEKYIPVNIENDMIDERWTISDYRLRIKQLTEQLQDLEHEYGMLKTIFASMSTSEFKRWKKQQKQEWFDLYSISSSSDNY